VIFTALSDIKVHFRFFLEDKIACGSDRGTIVCLGKYYEFGMRKAILNALFNPRVNQACVP